MEKGWGIEESVYNGTRVPETALDVDSPLAYPKPLCGLSHP